MTSTALRDSGAAGDVVLLPVGSVEQHGSHLPVDTDINGPLEAALEVGRQREWAIVAPPVWWGLSGAHREFPGTIALRPFTFYQLLEDICDGILASKFKLCLLVGHASNHPIVSTLVGEFASSGRGEILQLSYLGFAMSTFAEIRKSGIGGESHAGELETSVQMHLRPQLVVDGAEKVAHYVDSARDYGHSAASPDISIRGPVNVGFDLAASFPDGVIGDPTVATAETGAACWDAVIDGVITVLDEFHLSTKGNR